MSPDFSSLKVTGFSHFVYEAATQDMGVHIDTDYHLYCNRMFVKNIINFY